LNCSCFQVSILFIWHTLCILSFVATEALSLDLALYPASDLALGLGLALDLPAHTCLASLAASVALALTKARAAALACVGVGGVGWINPPDSQSKPQPKLGPSCELSTRHNWRANITKINGRGGSHPPPFASSAPQIKCSRRPWLGKRASHFREGAPVFQCSAPATQPFISISPIYICSPATVRHFRPPTSATVSKAKTLTNIEVQRTSKRELARKRPPLLLLSYIYIYNYIYLFILHSSPYFYKGPPSLWKKPKSW
jgi:hypothetical protein